MRTEWLSRFLAMFLLEFSLTLLGQSGQAQEVLWTSPYGGWDVATDSAENVLLTGGKLSPDGDSLWMRSLSGLTAWGVAADPWGNVIVNGYIYTDTASLEDYCTVKYSPTGDTIWTRTFDSGDWDEAHGVTTDPWGNVIVTGYTWGYEPCGDYLTIKYDPEGNMLWQRVYNWEWEDFAHDVAVDGEGNVIVTGQSDNNINWDWCTVKYGPGGDTLWIRRLDIGIDDFSYGVATDPWGNVIVVGQVHLGGVQNEAFVIKYSPDGDTLWAKLYYDIGCFYDVATDTAGSIVVIKTIYSTSGSDYYTLIMKLDASGDTLWTSRRYGVLCGSVTTDLSGNVIVTGGMTIKYEGNSGIEGENDHFFPRVFSLSQNYPNPFNSNTAINYQQSAVSLKIYNILGEEVVTLVDRIQDRGGYRVVWDGRDSRGREVGSGIYLYQLRVQTQKGGAYQKTRKMVLIR